MGSQEVVDGLSDEWITHKTIKHGEMEAEEASKRSQLKLSDAPSPRSLASSPGQRKATVELIPTINSHILTLPQSARLKHYVDIRFHHLFQSQKIHHRNGL